ncbi:MAG: hypothetical protein HY922_07410, partial [Elusimicrobia bacterium]|nr:hypothetical protein [Elusimicrobiota bacterium]
AITQGAVIKGNSGGHITLQGGLTAAGAAAKPVTFTSIKDYPVHYN